MVKPEILMRYIRIFSDLGNQIRYATQKRILIEIAIIKLCKPQMENSYDSILDRIASLEFQMEKGIVVQQAPAASGGEAAPAVQAQKIELPKAIPEDIQAVVQNWRSILSEIGAITKTYLKMAVPTLGNNGDLLLMLDDENAYTYLYENRSGCIDNLRAMITERTGKSVEITVRKNESGRRAQDVVPDLTQMIQFDIEEEDFNE